jgi:hypothetical protein
MLTPAQIQGEKPIQKYTLKIQGKETHENITRSKMKDIIWELVLTEEEVKISIRRNSK